MQSESANISILFDRFQAIYQQISRYLPDTVLQKQLAECLQLQQQLQQQEFPIVFCSAFPRGQSTIINALLQKPLLPTGTDSILNCPIIIKTASVENILIRFQDGSQQTLQHISELEQFVINAVDKRSLQEHIISLEIHTPNTGFPEKFVLIDLPCAQYTDSQQFTDFQKLISEQAKALVFCKGIEDVSFDHPDERKFFDQLQQNAPIQFNDAFLLINKWDLADNQQQTEAAEKLDKAIKHYGYAFAANRIYKISALNFFTLAQILNQNSIANHNADNLQRYADLDSIFADPAALLTQHPELSEFNRFKTDLTSYIQQTAVAELTGNARSSLLNIIDLLINYLQDSLDISADTTDDQSALQHLRENQIDEIFLDLKNQAQQVLQHLEQDISETSQITWGDAEQNALLNEIYRLLLDPERGVAKAIITGLNKGGFAVPETSRFVAEIFEAIRLDARVVASLEQAAASRQKLDKLKYALKQPYHQYWFDTLEKRVDAVLNPEYIVMRIYGILENIITWRIWHRDIEKKLDAANVENVEKIIDEINTFLIKNQEKLRERVQQTMRWHFHRYVIPKLQQIFAINSNEVNEFSSGLKNRIRSQLKQMPEHFSSSEQLDIAAEQKRLAVIALLNLKQEIYQV